MHRIRAALVLLLVAGGIAVGVCAHAGPPAPPPVDVATDPAALEQRASAVEVVVTCEYPPRTPWQSAALAFNRIKLGGSRGSGVAISPRAVTTALHVVDCDEYGWLGWRIVDGKPTKVEVLHAGKTYAYRVQFAGPSDDWTRYGDGALLMPVVDAELFSRHATRIGAAPAPGDVVCAVATVPYGSRACGKVLEYLGGAWWMGDGYYRVDAAVLPGNSGAGVYDASGALVGLVVAGSPKHTMGVILVSDGQP